MRRALRARAIGTTAVLAALAAAPGSAAGSVHFADNLLGTPTTGSFCGQHCTLWNTNIYPANTAGTITSPIDGVLVAWAFKQQTQSPGATTYPVHPRVLEQVGSQWRGLDAGADVIPTTAGGIQSYPTRLPINQGDYIAIEFDNNSVAPDMFADNIFGAVMKLRSPPFPTGGPPETISSSYNWQVLLRGTVEPDADHDGFRDETQDKCAGKNGPVAGCAKKKCKRKKRKGKKRAAQAKTKSSKGKRCKKKGKKRK